MAIAEQNLIAIKAVTHAYRKDGDILDAVGNHLRDSKMKSPESVENRNWILNIL